MTALFESDWPSRYRSWIAAARPALEAKDWAAGFRDYPWLTYEDTPWTPLRKPLAEARIALVTSGGLTLPGQLPFRAEDPEGDNSYRVVDGRGPLASWEIHHGHYDPAGALQDYNVVFPLDVMRDLSERLIAELAPHQISFMGYQTNVYKFFTESAANVVDVFKQDAVDAVILVPV